MIAALLIGLVCVIFALVQRSQEQRLCTLEAENVRLRGQITRQEERHREEIARLWRDLMGSGVDLLDMTDGSVSAYLEDHRN